MTGIQAAKRREDLLQVAPAMRRFAHALVVETPHHGTPSPADTLVLNALRQGCSAQTGRWPHDLKLFLYRAIIVDNRARLALEPAPAQRGGSDRHQGHQDHTSQDPRGSAARAPIQHGSAFLSALQRLPLEAREAFVLVALEHLNHSEAAEVLHVSKPALVDLLLHARQRMAAGLGTNLRVVS